jgi:hypothetical protein
LNGYQRHKVRAWTHYDIEMGRAGRANIGLLWRFDSGGVYSLAAGNQPLSDIQLARDPGYASIPPSQTLFFGARGSEFFESASRFDLALNYDIPVYKKLRPWLKARFATCSTTVRSSPSNTTITPDPESPLDKDGLPTGFTRGSRFGQGTSKNDYPVARTFLVSIGFRF